jgi:hypothetical protein
MNNKKLAAAVSTLLTVLLFPLKSTATDAAMAVVSGAGSREQPLGRFETFVAIPGNQGGIFHTWQRADQKGWQQSWQRYLPAPDGSKDGKNSTVVAARDGIGRIVVAWLANNKIQFAEAIHSDASLTQTPDSEIREGIGPNNTGSDTFTSLAIGKYPDGEVEVLALSNRGRIWSVRPRATIDDGKPWIGQTRTNGRLDRVANLVGGGKLRRFSVTSFGAGLAMAAVGSDFGTDENAGGKVYVKLQATAKTWDQDPWINLGGNKIQDVRIRESKDHQLEVVALGTDKKLYINYQNVGSSSFSGWQPLLTSRDFGRSFFFDRFSDGTLFVTTHFDLNDGSQYKGTFAKAFQSPNNGAWPGTLVMYAAVTTHGTATTNPDDLGFLSADAFALAPDVTGNINYFACYRSSTQVEHYIDRSGPASADPSKESLLAYQDVEHSMPNLPVPCK